MKVGVAKEIAPGERRVALIPETADKLRGAKLTVLVERGAGAALNEHGQLCASELVRSLGYQRHAPLARCDLLGDAHFHSDTTCCTCLQTSRTQARPSDK